MAVVVHNGRKIVIIIIKIRTTGNKKYGAKIRGTWTEPSKGINLGSRRFRYYVFHNGII